MSPTGGDSSHLDYRIQSPQGQMKDPTPVVANALGSGGPAQGRGGPEKTDGKTRIILVRHGTTGLNSEGKNRGWTDVPLNAQGEKEIKKLGKELGKKHKIDAIVSSDLIRAKQTALGLADQTKTKNITVHHGFRPWHLGNLHGKDIEETKPTLYDHAGNKPDTPLPGGESFNSFKNRFLGSIKEMGEKHKGKTIAVITHHRGDRAMAAWEKKGMPDDLGVDIKTFTKPGIDPATARKIVYDRRGKRIDSIATRLSKAHSKYFHPLTHLIKK